MCVSIYSTDSSSSSVTGRRTFLRLWIDAVGLSAEKQIVLSLDPWAVRVSSTVHSDGC